MKLYKQCTSFVVSGLLAGLAIPAHAEDICVAISAEVTQVEDLDGVLGNTIHPGDEITGFYIYNSTAQDSNTLATVGDYWHASQPYGITLGANGVEFKTDPNNVQFLVEIVNDHPPTHPSLARDNYLLRSYNNVFSVAGTTGHISWQLDDSTTSALSSEALPTDPPALADWQSIFGLTIDGFSDDFFSWFFIRSHVTSAQLCDDDTGGGDTSDELAQALAIIASLESELAAANVEIGNLNQALADKDTEIIALESTVLALTDELLAAGNTIADLDQAMSQLLAQIEALQADVDEAHQGLSEIQLLISQPAGQRQSGSHYTGSLGDSLNRTVDMLTQPAGRNVSAAKKK